MAQTPEAIVLRKNLTEIAELVSSHQDGPSWFADQLVAEDFVSSTDLVATGGLSPYRLVSRMLWPVEYKVKASYCDTAAEFFKLVGILEKRAAYSRLARHMVDEYRRNGGTSSPRGQQPIAPAGVCRNPGANNVETDGCPVSHAAGGASSNDGKLSSCHHVAITDYLLSLDPTAIHQLGIVLGLSHTKLTKLKETSKTFLDDVITAWLREEDSVMENCPPSWESLVQALRHPRLTQTGIAAKIERERVKKSTN